MLCNGNVVACENDLYGKSIVGRIGEQSLAEIWQKRMAQHMDIEKMLRGGISLKRVPYEIQGGWPEEKLRFMHIDCQQEGVFWWTVRACSGRKTRRLGFGKAFS